MAKPPPVPTLGMQIKSDYVFIDKYQIPLLLVVTFVVLFNKCYYSCTLFPP